MKKFIPVLKKSQIFAGVGDEEIASMLSCLGARLFKFRKGQYVLRQGEHVSDIIILVEGNLHVQRDDYWGNRSILGRVSAGEVFGEAYAAPGSGALLNDVVALEDSAVIFFDIKRIITTCPSACHFHALVVQNMSKRTTREKLISYLSEEAKKQNNSCFVIPFNRQQLADFLSVDRSAMSNELCKMRDEGLIEFNKSYFKLL